LLDFVSRPTPRWWDPYARRSSPLRWRLCWSRLCPPYRVVPYSVSRPLMVALSASTQPP